MEAWFDSQTVIGTDQNGNELPPKEVVFFHLHKAATTQPAVPFTFDGPATEAHKKEYSAAWQAYEDSLQKAVPVEEEMQAAPVSFMDKLGGLING